MIHLRRINRNGISLIEVIACTVIVTVMVIPIAGVIRVSGQSIARSNNGSPEANLRTGVRWLIETIHAGDVLEVGSDYLVLLTTGGEKVVFEVRSDQLVMDDGGNQVVLMDPVDKIEFSSIHQTDPPNLPIGITMTLRVKDPATGKLNSIDATISLPPQI